MTVVPLALLCRNVEEAPHPGGAGGGEHFVLALGEAGVIEVAMAVDQHSGGLQLQTGEDRDRLGDRITALAAIDQVDQRLSRGRNNGRDGYS